MPFRDRRSLAIVFVVLCVIGFWLSHRYRSRKAASLRVPPGPIVPKEMPSARELASKRPPLDQLLATDREGRRKEIGLRNIKLASTGDKEILRVKTRVKKWCGGGDLNAIALDLKNSDDKTILMSVEPLDGSEGGFVKKLQPWDLFRSFETEFQVPRSSGKPTQMGFFICKDSKGSGKCSNKPSTDVNKVFFEHTRRGRNAKYQADDHVYAFQYLLFEGNGSLSVFDNAEPAKHSFTKLGKYVETIGGKPGDAVETAMDRTLAIRTLAPDSAASGIELSLPVMDPEICKANAKNNK